MKRLLIMMFCMIPFLIFSTTRTVNCDGSANYISIQSAIDAAISGDIILIEEGIYYEDVLVSDKSLTITSLFYNDANESHIGNTILDGENQHQLLTISMQNYSHSVEVIGLTLRNANGLQDASSILSGGAISAKQTNLTISHCSIYNNIGKYGGGLFIASCETTFIANSVRDNKAAIMGGGLFLQQYHDYYDLPIVFDVNDRNNFYNNYASGGLDLCIRHTDYNVAAYCDTLGIDGLDFYSNIITDGSNDMHEIAYVVAGAEYLDRVNADLYVSLDGDDNNDGLTPTSALRSIRHAAAVIAPDEYNQRTINMLPGEYTLTDDEMMFPFSLRDNTILSGAGPELTILNCEDMRGHIVSRNGISNVEIRNLAMVNHRISEEGRIGFPFAIDFKPLDDTGYEIQSNSLLIDNVHFIQTNYHDPHQMNEFVSFGSSSVSITNCQFGSYDVDSEITLSSIRGSGIHDPNDTGTIRISKNKFINQTDQIRISSGTGDVIIDNCLFDSREAPTFFTEGLRFYIFINGQFNTSIVNNSIWGDHYNSHVSSCLCIHVENSYDGSDIIANIANNIVVDNLENNLIGSIQFVDNNYYGYNNQMYVNSNLLPGGESMAGSAVHDGQYVFWDGNLDAEPHYTGYGINGLMLNEISPCIDSGTLNLPVGFEQPATDIAGNSRVYGENIDMGCYEWQGNIADFTMQAIGNTFPIEIEFTPYYNYPIDTIAWDLDLDGVIDSYEMNPVWSYPDFNGHNVGMYINEGEAIEVKYDCIQPTTPIIEETNDTPEANELLACYPNPVRLSTGNVVVKYNVKEVGNAVLNVFNIKGQLVKSISASNQAKGSNTLFWYLTDNRGVHVPSGIYIYNLKQNGETIGKGQITVVK